MIGIFVKRVLCGILVHVTPSVIRHLKLMNIKNIENCSCEKRLIGKLVLGCEDKILNTTKTSPYNKRVICEKRNCFNHTILLAITRLLFLAVASIGCYYYYTRDWMKKEYLASY